MDLFTRTVNISSYIESRSQELLQFKAAIDTKMHASTKLPHQQVPKHLRRRAMSHNRYRIPFRIRKNLQKEYKLIEQTQDPVKCRKQIRKPKLLAQSYKIRNNKVKWLETHLWMAKRMKMIEYFGYKIAQNPVDKSSRCCYKLAKNETVVCDLTYYKILQIQGQINYIQILISKYFKPTDIEKIFKCHVLDGKISLENINMFINPENPELILLLGPVQILWNNQNDLNNLLIFFHPGMTEQLQSIFYSESIMEESKIQIFIHGENYNIFELIGKASLSKISDLLQNLNFQETEKQSEVIQYFSEVMDPGIFPKGLIIQVDFLKIIQLYLFYFNKSAYLESEGEHSQKLIKPPQGYSQKITTSLQISQQNDVIQKIANLSINNYHTNQTCIWANIKDRKSSTLPDEKYKVVNRSRYTHKKKDKIKKKEKEKALHQFNSKQMKTQDNNNIDSIQSNRKYEETFQIEQTSYQNQLENKIQKKFSICLILSNYNNTLGNIKIICNQGVGHIIFKKLTFLSCKVIGLRDYQHIRFELGMKNFPQDYPGTDCFNIYQKQIQDKALQTYERKPKSKRMNYEKINSPYPFGCNFDALIQNFTENPKITLQHNDLVGIQINMLQKGVPLTNSYICLPIDDDFNNMSQQTVNGDRIGHITDEIQNKEKQYQTIDKKKISRQIIGFVTTGNFKISEGKAGAIGYVLKYYLNESQHQSQFWVIIRKVGSVCYFLAKANVIIN